MVAATFVLAAVGFGAVGTWFAVDAHPMDESIIPLIEQARMLTNVFVYGMLITQIGTNYLRGVRPTR
jgi:hypothetical protein